MLKELSHSNVKSCFINYSKSLEELYSKLQSILSKNWQNFTEEEDDKEEVEEVEESVDSSEIGGR